MERKELQDLRNQCSKLEKQVKKHLKRTLKIYQELLVGFSEQDSLDPDELGVIVASLGLQTSRVLEALDTSDLSVQELASALKHINKTAVVRTVKEK